MCEDRSSRGAHGEFKYSELKPFGELLIGRTEIAGPLETVDNRGMIPTTERIPDICKVRIQQFT